MLLDGIPNIQQLGDLECLVACSKQVLLHLGIDRSERWLWNQLQTSTGRSTSFDNLAMLEKSLGLVVEMHRYSEDILLFGPYLELGLPILVAVDADIPESWPYYKEHAVVVVGYDDEYVYVNDPAQEETGLAVDLDTFLLVWGRRDYEFAVLRLV